MTLVHMHISQFEVTTTLFIIMKKRVSLDNNRFNEIKSIQQLLRL